MLRNVAGKIVSVDYNIFQEPTRIDAFQIPQNRVTIRCSITGGSKGTSGANAPPPRQHPKFMKILRILCLERRLNVLY